MPLWAAVEGRAVASSLSFISLDRLPGVSVEDRLRGGGDAVPTLTTLTVVVFILPGTRPSRDEPGNASLFWMTLPIVGYAEGEWGGEGPDVSESGGEGKGEETGGPDSCSEELGECRDLAECCCFTLPCLSRSRIHPSHSISLSPSVSSSSKPEYGVCEPVEDL